jgi:hypothetical protein
MVATFLSDIASAVRYRATVPGRAGIVANPWGSHHVENMMKSLVYARLVFSAREAPAYAAAASASSRGSGATFAGVGFVFAGVGRRARAVVFGRFGMGVTRRIIITSQPGQYFSSDNRPAYMPRREPFLSNRHAYGSKSTKTGAAGSTF